MGGIIYHRMGEKFCSPTINLWMFEKDFQKFCMNLIYYKASKLKFISSEKKYPVARLGEGENEITIYFMHYKSKEEAGEKWYERMNRINTDNLFVIATDNGMSEDELKEWGKMKCRNMVIFVAKKYPNLEYTFWLRKYEAQDNVGKYVNDVDMITGLRYVEKEFDFVEFLNKKQDI